MMTKYNYSGLYSLMDDNGYSLSDLGLSEISKIKIERGLLLNLDQLALLCGLFGCDVGDMVSAVVPEDVFEKYCSHYTGTDYGQFRRNNTVYFALASLAYAPYDKVSIEYLDNGQSRRLFLGTASEVVRLYGDRRPERSYISGSILHIRIAPVDPVPLHVV